MKKALVVGGNSGIGQSIVLKFLSNGAEHIYIVGKFEPNWENISEIDKKLINEKITFVKNDLNLENYNIFDEIRDIDTLVITAGFGRVSLFENLPECEIKNLIKCNELGPIQIISKYYKKIKLNSDFYCAVMVSICGHIVSPYYTVYGAAKAGLAKFIENVNVELAASGVSNRILDCSPGLIEGTAFNGGRNDPDKLKKMAAEIVDRMCRKETLYIPQYDEIYRDVIARYHMDPMEYGLYSYNYKQNSGRIRNKPQVVVGYLSGTFDLFHIGHLNLLRRAREQCDYLIVGVHESGAWKGKDTFIPFEERKAILGSVRYVDKVVKSFAEDSDAWEVLHFDKLFVGSDYKGSARFQRYEEFFKGKGVEIVYFPYTEGTSSTQLREAISIQKNIK